MCVKQVALLWGVHSPERVISLLLDQTVPVSRFAPEVAGIVELGFRCEQELPFRA